MHSILELFACNFLLWNSASVYRIAGFVFLHRNVLSTHIRKWYYHQNTVEFKESVANHFKLTLFEILPLTMGKNGVKIEKEEWNLTVNEILTYCFTCPSTFSTLIFLSGTSTAEVWESQVRQSATQVQWGDFPSWPRGQICEYILGLSKQRVYASLLTTACTYMLKPT